MWAIFKAKDGIYFTGIKAPHKNAEPSDITFTTPLIDLYFLLDLISRLPL